MENRGIIRKLAVELLDRGLCPSEVSSKLRSRGYAVSSGKLALLGILRQAGPEVVILDDVYSSVGIGRLPPAYMASLLEDTWYAMPFRAQMSASNLIDTIVVTRPDDPRLSISPRVSPPRAALHGTTLLLPSDSDPEEIWHEVGHSIIDWGLTPSESDAIERFYDFDREQRSPPEVLAEDFYFTVKGDKTSPFWQWWFTGGDSDRMAKVTRKRSAGATKEANDIDPLDIVEAALDSFADLIFDSGDEQYVWFYGIALDALQAARKEDQLAYEHRGGPHQYYYPEDVDMPAESPRGSNPMNQPLRVERPDVTIRSTEPTAPGPGIM